LLLGFGTLLWRLHGLAFGESQGANAPGPTPVSALPMMTHLALVLVAGFWLPGPLVAWFKNVATLLG
jgi:hydrogenase-4 component F